MNQGKVVLAVAMGAIGAGSSAQLNSFDIRVSNTISPDQPSAVVEIWAVWDPAMYAFAGAMFDVHAAADPGGFSDPRRMLMGPGSSDGDVQPGGDLVTDIRPFQLQWWQWWDADTANPILIWYANWSTSDFTPRHIDLSTATTEFGLYINEDGVGETGLGDFSEASGVIQVVPSPAAAILPAFVGAFTRRSRTGGA
jgi:hypothetical protein